MERLSVDSSFSGHGMEEMNSLRGLWSLGGGAFHRYVLMVGEASRSAEDTEREPQAGAR